MTHEHDEEQPREETGPAAPISGPVPLPSRIHRGPIDVVLLAAVCALVSIGLLTIYGTSSLNAYFDPASHGDSFFYFKKQASGAIFGVFLMVVAMRTDFSIYSKYVAHICVGTMALVGLTYIDGLSHAAKGASRWVQIGPVNFQPSELVKMAVVIFIANSITKKADSMRNLWDAFGSTAIVLFPFVLLLMGQPDFGTTLIICALTGIMLYVGGARWAPMMGVLLIGVALAVAAIIQKPYRMERVRTWLNPWADASDSGYQLVNSFVALASGGLSGAGFGEGRGKLGYLPELYNDFVASSVGEELGLVGMALLCILYLIILWRGVVIAFEARDSFGAFLAFGITLLITIQAGFNLCVVTGIAPTKGLTLPLVSYGRTSLMIVLACVGILLNISQRNPDLTKARSTAKEQQYLENTLRHTELRFRQLRAQQSKRRPT